MGGMPSTSTDTSPFEQPPTDNQESNMFVSDNPVDSTNDMFLADPAPEEG